MRRVVAWRCQAHQVEGPSADDSLEQHQKAEHGGAVISVMFLFETEEDE